MEKIVSVLNVLQSTIFCSVYFVATFSNAQKQSANISNQLEATISVYFPFTCVFLIFFYFYKSRLLASFGLSKLSFRKSKTPLPFRSNYTSKINSQSIMLVPF